MANIVPQLDRLKAQLLTSGLSQKNQPLFQVINQLIDALRQGLDDLSSQITILTPSTSSGGSSTIITNGGLTARDGEDGADGLIGLPGPQGLRGLTGLQGPPGMDGSCDGCDCMPFVGNSIIDPTTLAGTYVQRIP